jgi:hypothetical protein
MCQRRPVYKKTEKEWVYETVQNKLGDNRLGTILLYNYIEEVGTSICNYINRDYVPDPLRFVYVNLVMDLLKSEALNGNIDNEHLSDVSTGTIASIKDGDSELKFSSKANTQAHVGNVDSFLYNYTQQLDKYRLLKW